MNDGYPSIAKQTITIEEDYFFWERGLFHLSSKVRKTYIKPYRNVELSKKEKAAIAAFYEV